LENRDLTKGVRASGYEECNARLAPRLIVSVGIGGTSYAFMLGIIFLSVVYDQEFEPIIIFAFDAGRSITNSLVSRQRSLRIRHQAARNSKPGAVGRCLEK
jgi:hypothetical protein